MKELIAKISDYKLFNYIFPAICFVEILRRFTHINLINTDNEIYVNIVIYYLIGLIISRIGSLVLEPFFKLTGFINYSNYGEFIEASKIDPTIKILSEANNTYRTLCVSFLILFIISFFHRNLVFSFTDLTLYVIFSFSYRKQTRYIKGRISKALYH